MKNYIKFSLLGACCVAAFASAQDIVLTVPDLTANCTVALDANEAVLFEADGDIAVTTATPIPTSCVNTVIGGGGAVALAATKDTVEEDESFNLDYAVPEGAGYSCTLRRGGAVLRNDGQITRPTGTVFNQTITADTNYELTCERDTAQGEERSLASALVDFDGQIIDPPPNGTLCSTLPNGSRTPNVAWERNNVLIGTASDYEGLFGPWPLGESFQSSVYRIDIDRGTYASLPFSIPANAADNALVSMVWEESPTASSSTIVSVSQCIGGVLVSQAISQNGCHVVGNKPGGNISFGVNPQGSCVLQKGGNYFLNIMDYSEQTSSTTCSANSCTWLVQVSAIGAVPD